MVKWKQNIQHKSEYESLVLSEFIDKNKCNRRKSGTGEKNLKEYKTVEIQKNVLQWTGNCRKNVVNIIIVIVMILTDI